MSVKHVKEYYEEICAQYKDMLDELKDFEQLCMEGMVQPEMIDQAKKMIEPIKNNWQTLNYIIFLLNKPNKKCKQNRYNNQNKKYLINCKTKQQVLDENQKHIDEIRNSKNQL